MMHLRTAAAVTAVVGLMLAAAGCGKSGSDAATSAGPTAKAALEDLAELLKFAKAENRRPPAKPADLAPYEAVFLTATVALQQRQIEYAWGADLSGGQAVLAHDAKAASDGGWVLLQDGTVKQMTADEFKAAPKAGKK